MGEVGQMEMGGSCVSWRGGDTFIYGVDADKL